MRKNYPTKEEMAKQKELFKEAAKKYLTRAIREILEMTDDLFSEDREVQLKAIIFSRAMMDCLDTFDDHFNLLCDKFNIEFTKIKDN